MLTGYTGRLELFHHIRSKLGLYNCVGTTAQYAIQSCILHELGGLELVVTAVLKTLICQHPIMGVGLVDEKKGQNTKWKRLRTIDLREVMTFKCIHHSHNFILDEHQKPFDRPDELPLWRVVIAKHTNGELTSRTDGVDHQRDADTIFDVGFYFSHAIADGTSGAAFHLDFVDALNTLGVNGIAVDEPPEFIVSVPELPLLQPLDDTPWPITVMFLLRTVFRTFVWSGQNPQGQWLGPPVTFDPDHSPKTRLLPIFLSFVTIERISLLCHRERTSVTALLTFLIARQLAFAYPDYSDFPALIAVSLRRFTGLKIREMGDHVSGVQVACSTKGLLRFVPSESVSWETLRNYKMVIHGSASSPTNQIVGLLKYAGDLFNFFKNQRRENAFEISNIGLVDGGMDGTGVAKFRRFVFSQSANVTGSPYVFSIASVKNGDMCIALTWQEGILEEAKAKQVVNGLEADLYTFAAGGVLETII